MSGYRFAPVRRVRLDHLLSERGMFPSRTRAAASVLAGEVMLLPERRRAEKPGQLVPEDVQLELAQTRQFVSRGGVKLANALDALGIGVTGRRALDVGASTGGFTDCLLQRGAEHVVALDVAYGQLDWKLRSDPRVTVIERHNARPLKADALPYAPDLIVIDVSFISVAKVLPAALACAAERLRLPGAGQAPVRGRPRAASARAGSCATRRCGAARWWPSARRRSDWARAVLGFASSGLPGPKGNLESFAWLGAGSRPGVADLEAAARQVEP